jgi:hypothetical protein
MSYVLVTSGRTEYAVDWDIVERFCKSYWSAYYQDQYSTLNKLSESSWYNPFSWSMPEIQTVDFDWAKVKSSTQTAVARDMSEYKRGATSDMRSVAYDVKYKVEQTAFLKRSTKDWLREIQDANISAMQKSEDNYTGLIDACKFVRDTSTDIVAIGSTIATGGAAVPLLGASSMLKGVYKYQDTGKAGAAVLYGAGSMVLGAFKIRGANLTSGGEYTLVIAQGILEGTTSMASGKSFGDAVADGSLKIASAGASQAIFSNGVVKEIFGRMPVPFTVFSVTSRSGVEYMAEDIADKLVEKTSKKLVEKGVKAAVPAAANLLTAPRQPASASGAGSGFIDDVPIEQMGLLYFAIVNMDNGIGRGW